MKQITIITGATASGKTNYSLEYSKSFKKAIIINADASAIYKSFPILTTQPSKEEKDLLPHLLFEIKDIKEDFSVSKWLFLVEEILNSTKYFGYHKIIVGGTCMYIFLLINGLIKTPEISLEERAKALELYNNIGQDEFLKLVRQKDQNTSIDRQRLINNYSLIMQTGKSFTEWQKEPKKTFLKQSDFNLIKINPPREEIYTNCNNRFLSMLSKGAEDEAKEAMLKYGKDFNFSKILCVNEIKAFLNGEITRERMIELCKQKTRNLAKSQITWLNNKLTSGIEI
jgi:tRNA dimethylallyltransferase